MFMKAVKPVRAALNRLKDRLAEWCLGPATRAGHFVADRDAAIVGLRACPVCVDHI